MEHKINHSLTAGSKGIPNMILVKESGGYSNADTSLLKLSDDITLFYVYILYMSYNQRKSGIVNYDNQFLYHGNDPDLWEDLQFTQEYFMKKLNKLEAEGCIKRISGRRKEILYHVNPVELTDKMAIPVVFITSRLLSWTNKIRFFKLLLTLQKNKIQEYKYLPSSNKTVNPKTGLTPKALDELTRDFIAAGFIDPNERIINTTNVLCHIQLEQHQRTKQSLMFVKHDNVKKDAVIKRLRRHIKDLEKQLE